HFLRMNPGLKSRFPFHMPFEDYSVNELLKIARKITAEKEYTLTNEAMEKLQTHLLKLKREPIDNFANGRHIRNLIEESIRKQSMRILLQNRMNLDDLMDIT